MRSINLPALEKLELAREAETAHRLSLHKQRKIFRAARNRAGPNIYRLFENGQPTDTLKEMRSEQKSAEQNALRARFIKHVNDCLDAGIPTTEPLCYWKMDTHFLDRTDIDHTPPPEAP